MAHRAEIRHQPPTAFITGANGYIGAAVCKAFIRAGYRVFGLVRRPESAADLIRNEIIPVVGSLDDLSFLEQLYTQAPTFDVIINNIEGFGDYEVLFTKISALVKELATKSNAGGVKPLLLWSSGCKDYPLSPFHGDAGLAPLTEESPILSALPPARVRAETSLRVFDLHELVDAIILRPTSVYGYSSSYYGFVLDHVKNEKARGANVLRIPGNPNSVMHSLHVDDCAEAYVSLAQHPRREEVAGQAFNISGYRYETAGETAAALAQEYGLSGGVEFVPVEDAQGKDSKLENQGALSLVFYFSQWIGSDKIRKVTGWTDKRGLFCENLHVYRLAYEAEQQGGHENINLINNRIHLINQS
ncbi:unnamed protein product [Clonostachys byssicola]|uniref:NAD-dependent epimerase/dehydratase domain-containing protein n=1 Tax=Clonostachys byssicola TaxID=160290 RepID=A0A9N9XVH7_9HYPO|nr:unnamed protein product [Clonostachys byssicola]